MALEIARIQSSASCCDSVCQLCPPLQAWLSNILLILLILCPFRRNYLQGNLLLFSDWFYSHRLIFSFIEETHLSPFEILLEAKKNLSNFMNNIFLSLKAEKALYLPIFRHLLFMLKKCDPWQLIFNAFNHLQFLFTYRLEKKE